MNEITGSSEAEVHEDTTSQIDFEVLHPENALLKRFQNSLKQLLETKLRNINDDIYGAEGEIKKIRNETKILSEILHNQKCELSKMEETLYEYNESVSDFLSSKEQEKIKLDHLKDEYSKKSKTYETQEKLNIELRNKLEVQNYMLQQLRSYEQKEISNLLIKQQAISKNKRDKLIHQEEKNRQDHLLMKLENEIFKLRLFINDHKEQLYLKCNALVVIQEKVGVKNSDVFDSSQENARLIKLWKNVVFLVSRRDEKYSEIKKDLEKSEIAHKQKTVELNSCKRSADEQMYRNGTLTANRNQKEQFLNQLKQNYSEMLERRKQLDNELDNTCVMIESTAKSLKDAKEIEVNYNRSLCTLEVQLKKLNSKNYELEELILSQLHNEVISSNVSSKLNEEIHKLRDQVLQQELTLKELQQNYSNSVTFLKQKENALNTNFELLKKKKTATNSINKVLSNSKEKLSKMKLQIKQQNNVLDQENKQLYLWEEQPIQGSNLSERVNIVKENTADITHKIATQKRLWIRKQNEIMLFTEKKSELILNLSSVQTRVNVFEQKLSRLGQDVIKTENESAAYDKSVFHMLNLISKLNAEYYTQKQCEITLDNKNCLIQNNVLEKLKKAEEDMSLLIEEIGNLTEMKESLEKELLDDQREDLEWEKKVKLAQEMKENIMKEQSENGDIGGLRNEIHRMEIRYAQLKKAQESLVSDLDTTVHKRSRIFDKNLVKEKEDTSRIKQAVIRKIEIVLAKIKKLNEKIENFEAECRNLYNQKCQIVKDIKNYEERISSLQNIIHNLDEKVLEYTFLKQKNLEILIRKQKLAEFFVHVKSGKFKNVCPNQLTIEKNYVKYQNLQSDLNQVLEALCKDFPTLINQIMRIVNVLQSQSR